MNFPKSIVVLSLLCAFGSSAHAEENCGLVDPPKGSYVSNEHGIYLFIFPKKISATYNGCQTTWDEHGTVWFVTRFKDGDVVEHKDTTPSTPPHPPQICKYEHKQAFSSNDNDCPAYESLLIGINALAMAKGLHVPPPDRDPRK